MDQKKPEKARITVTERASQTTEEALLADPFGEKTSPIQLKDPEKVARWFNSSIRPDNIWRAKNRRWLPEIGRAHV